MAPKVLIKNKKGQALLETAFLLIFSGTFLYFLLNILMKIIFAIALEAMAEDYFFCELAKKRNCQIQLENRLKQNQIRDVQINVQHQLHKITLTISGRHLQQIKINREFDYEKFIEQF